MLHLMLNGLKQPLTSGSKVPVTFTIKTDKGKTEIIKVMVTVKALVKMDTDHAGHHLNKELWTPLEVLTEKNKSKRIRSDE